VSASQKQSGARAPAPGALELVQAFVNTNDIEGRRDRLTRPESARSWLAEQGLLERGEGVSELEFLRLLDVREALRALALANNGVPVEEGALEVLNKAATGGLSIRFTPEGGMITPAGAGVEGAIGFLLAIVLEAAREGNWLRLKACRREVCRWVFYDYSRNRSSSWCSMAICGNRTKTRTYRRRRNEARRARA
jgi:predicted RNA-binding Zn ribbon-like protein